MYRITLMILTIISLTACNTLSKIEQSTPVVLNPEQIAQIKTTVTERFYDAESARFKNIKAVNVRLANGYREVRVCGRVNGKNLEGGYTGYSMFGGTLENGRFKRADFFAPCEVW